MGLEGCSGTYVLCFESRVERQVDIGRFGRMGLRPGFYLYVGSAHGPGGLCARLARHRRRDKRKRWHIDYLRTHVRLLEVWCTCNENRLESEWSAVVASIPGASVPMPGFGASDCPGEEHLFAFVRLPEFGEFVRRCHDPRGVKRVAARALS